MNKEIVKKGRRSLNVEMRVNMDEFDKLENDLIVNKKFRVKMVFKCVCNTISLSIRYLYCIK